MINENAVALNNILQDCVAGRCLSRFGSEAYMPNGITVQSAQAKEMAKNYNATVGIATKEGVPMALDTVRKFFSSSLTNSEIFAYSAGLGNPSLRSAWKKEMLYKNPGIENLISTPIVTAGLTNSLFITCQLFLEKNDVVLLPNLYWENYDLIFDYHPKAKVKKYNFFSGKGFNTKGLRTALSRVKTKKAVVVLNFPNNPTGYSPSVKEADEIARVIKEASENKDIVVILDDAYFSLFFEKDTYKESLFSKLSNISENVLAVKCDAATKECEVWGFRVGFLTFGYKGAKTEEYKALESKISGIIRGTISNCSTPAQNVLLHALTDDENKYRDQKAAALECMKKRYKIFRLELIRYRDKYKLLKPLSFNSGYFMSFEVKDDKAVELKDELLKQDGIGVIALFGKYIRVAFSSLDDEKIPSFLQALYSRCEKFFA